MCWDLIFNWLLNWLLCCRFQWSAWGHSLKSQMIFNRYSQLDLLHIVCTRNNNKMLSTLFSFIPIIWDETSFFFFCASSSRVLKMICFVRFFFPPPWNGKKTTKSAGFGKWKQKTVGQTHNYELFTHCMWAVLSDFMRCYVVYYGSCTFFNYDYIMHSIKIAHGGRVFFLSCRSLNKATFHKARFWICWVFGWTESGYSVNTIHTFDMKCNLRIPNCDGIHSDDFLTQFHLLFHLLGFILYALKFKVQRIDPNKKCQAKRKYFVKLKREEKKTPNTADCDGFRSFKNGNHNGIELDVLFSFVFLCLSIRNQQ